MPDTNTDLFDLINGLAGRWGPVDEAGRFCATWLVWGLGAVVFGGLAASALRSRSPRQASVLAAAVASLLVALLLGSLMKDLFAMPRPFSDHAGTHLLVARPSGYSFPSNHAVAGGALACSASIAWSRLRAAWFTAGLAVALGRVFAGVHYPVDALAGLALGVAVAFIIHRLVARGLPRTPDGDAPRSAREPAAPFTDRRAPGG